MRLKNLLILKESLSDSDNIIEGKGWFCHCQSNDWDKKLSGASVYITEGEPHKFWVKIKTHGLRKPNDTNESYKERIKKHTGKVAKSWVTSARKIYNQPEVNEVGNIKQVTWKEAFQKALENPKLSPYISEWGQAENADPVNFTNITESISNSRTTYSCVLLDERSHFRLIESFHNIIPDDWKIYAHHMTIKLGELPYDKKQDIGKSVTLKITDLGISEKAIAVKVNGYYTINKIPHITLAVNSEIGAKPVDSNSIVNWKPLTELNLHVTGVITEVPFN